MARYDLDRCLEKIKVFFLWTKNARMKIVPRGLQHHYIDKDAKVNVIGGEGKASRFFQQRPRLVGAPQREDVDPSPFWTTIRAYNISKRSTTHSWKFNTHDTLVFYASILRL